MTFDTVIMVDWSGGNDKGATPQKDSIWTCVARGSSVDAPRYHRNRQVAEIYLRTTLEAEQIAGRRTLVGFDFCFAYPIGFAKALTGTDDPLVLWDWFAERVQDSPDSNNRFQLADEINSLCDGIGPFWGTLGRDKFEHLHSKGSLRTCRQFPEKRAADAAAKGALSPWQLAYNGAVGSQVIMGLPTLSRLRRHFGPSLKVWPFEDTDADIVLAETYFSLIPQALAASPSSGIKDADQVSLFAKIFASLPAATLGHILDVAPTPEGWVMGLGHQETLEKHAAALAVPTLRNDCFAMPQGAHWTPVDDALAHLRANLGCVTGMETSPIDSAAGRILGQNAIALRSHPPQPNAAVDGYGFAGPAPDGLQQMPLVKGRSAAGQPYAGTVPAGHAIRILTGANLPSGVDTVILQEDVTALETAIAFRGPLKRGANARKAGEDMQEGQTILTAGRRLTPADLATMTATGIGQVEVRQRLCVGVLSTGDELVTPGSTAHEGQIFDANRPMLMATVASWGHTVIDLGRAPDNRAKTRAILDDAAPRCDVILTSGGASAGDEDHMSALLQGTGTLALWRIAVKPGRPLALGMWQNTPVFGLPGNPVAAQVCALVFAHPALSVLAGAGWAEPTTYQIPAGFTKSKKAGRREYLRARVTNGIVEIFPSEGSGRVSGLSWATGLVVLADDALDIAPGDMVTFLPFTGMGL